VALIVCVQAAKTDAPERFGAVPPLVVTGWLVFGLWQLGHFQKAGAGLDAGARPRQNCSPLLDFGLSPFSLLVEPEYRRSHFFTAVGGG